MVKTDCTDGESGQRPQRATARIGFNLSPCPDYHSEQATYSKVVVLRAMSAVNKNSSLNADPESYRVPERRIWHTVCREVEEQLIEQTILSHNFDRKTRCDIH
jgi:hypothetical protein